MGLFLGVSFSERCSVRDGILLKVLYLIGSASQVRLNNLALAIKGRLEVSGDFHCLCSEYLLKSPTSSSWVLTPGIQARVWDELWAFEWHTCRFEELVLITRKQAEFV